MCFYWWFPTLEPHFVEIRFRESVFFNFRGIVHLRERKLVKWPSFWNGTLFHLLTQIIIIWRTQWCNFYPKIPLGKWLSEVGSIRTPSPLGTNGWEIPQLLNWFKSLKALKVGSRRWVGPGPKKLQTWDSVIFY